MRMSGFVISRRHLEGSILLRWVNWQVAIFFAMPSARRCTFWSEHESAYYAIQTGMIKQERIKRTDFRTCTKVKMYWYRLSTMPSYMYLFRRNQVLQQWSTPLSAIKQM